MRPLGTTRTVESRTGRPVPSIQEIPLTGVVFDFGNVLYSVDYPAMARDLAGEWWERLIAAFVGSPLQCAYECGRASLDEVLRELGRLGFPVGRDRFLQAYLSIFTPVPGMRELLSGLAGRVPLGLLSNTSPEHAALFIRETPEFAWFDAAVFSFEVGCMKPDPRTYREVVARMGLPGTELAYTDDVEEYALAAKSSGMTGIPFRGLANLAAALSRLGLLREADA